MEAWEKDGYLALLLSILQEKSVDVSLKLIKAIGKDKKISTISRPRWKREEIEIIITMTEEGKDTIEVAKELGKTPTQVVQKKWDLTRKGLLKQWT